MKKFLHSFVLLSLMIGTEAKSAPIFVSVAERYGLGQYKDKLRVLEDSEDKKIIYFLPAKLSLPKALFSSLPSFLRPPLASSFDQVDAQTSRIDFYVVLDLDLKSFLDIVRITKNNAEEKGFLVARLECFDPKLNLVNIPSMLISNFSQTDGKTILQDGEDSFFAMLANFVSPDDMVPGYLTRFSISTKNERQISNLLYQHGARGQAEYSCLGYTDQMKVGVEAPTIVKTSVPLSIAF